MAKDKDNGIGHNVADQEGIIQNCATEMARIKSARKDLNKQAGDVRKRIDAIGIQPKVFEYSVRIAELEVAAQKEHKQQLELCFDALGVGQGVSAEEAAQDALDKMAGADQA